MAYNMVYLGKHSMYTWKECVFCCYMEYSINVNSAKLSDSVVQVFYTFTVFCLLDLLIIEKRVLKAPAIIVDMIDSSCSSISFASWISVNSYTLIRCIHIYAPNVKHLMLHPLINEPFIIIRWDSLRFWLHGFLISHQIWKTFSHDLFK